MNDIYTPLVGKRILIIGGTGSIGSAILNRLHEVGVSPALVTIASRDETKHHYLRIRCASLPFPVKTVILDIRSEKGLRAVIDSHDFVFAAAAMKHVPIVEEFPAEGIRTNLLGAMNIIEALRESPRPRGIVAFSTDKACYPECAMGMTKALQERLFLAASKDPEFVESKVNVVRYGNLLASRGSALPVFVEQLKSGNPVTITHEDMTRFFSFMADAADLCIRAATASDTGHLYVPKLKSAKLVSVVDTLAELLGIKEYPIKVIGIRGSEKLHETMLNEHEQARVVSLPDDNFMKIGVLNAAPLSPIGNPHCPEYVSDSDHYLMTKDELTATLERFLRINL